MIRSLNVALVAFLLLPGAQAAAHHSHRLRMSATAFSLDAKPTAAGTTPQDGVVAADPRVLPLGTRIRLLDAGAYSGTYLVTDKGASVKGRHIDVYVPTVAEAKQFGKKMVTVEILEIGHGRADARVKSPTP